MNTIGTVVVVAAIAAWVLGVEYRLWENLRLLRAAVDELARQAGARRDGAKCWGCQISPPMFMVQACAGCGLPFCSIHAPAHLKQCKLNAPPPWFSRGGN